jgi:hypothetical protein
MGERLQSKVMILSSLRLKTNAETRETESLQFHGKLWT